MSITLNNKDHIQGNENAPVILVEYGDYQCPYCGEAYYRIKEAQKKLGKDLKVVFRNFPLTQIHPFALHAAIAAEAAGNQGKFWEMHDILFENQENLRDSDILKYAEKIGLEMSEFENDLNNNMFFEKIKEDFDSGIKLNIEGTPALFINGKLFEGNWMKDDLVDYMKSLTK